MKPKVNMKINNGLPKRQDWAERIKMETKDKATARPWQVMEHKTTPFVADAAGWCITNGRLKRELRANANLIVRAVNAWDSIERLKIRISELEEK